MRLMGIDYGSKKVGVALSDEAQSMAFPEGVFENNESLLNEIAAVVDSKQVNGIVIGDSRDYQGAPNPVAEAAKQFALRLRERLDLPIVFEPEVLTTKEAERIQGSTRLTDASAAAIILQSYIDKQHQDGKS